MLDRIIIDMIQKQTKIVVLGLPPTYSEPLFWKAVTDFLPLCSRYYFLQGKIKYLF